MQVVGYRVRAGPTESGERQDPPAVLVAEAGKTRWITLSAETSVAHGLGSRHCAGDVGEDGHTQCDRSRSPYCRIHERPLYDPGTSEETHAVYLAAFAPDLFKVGITKRWRLETRLREQGADRGALGYTVTDGTVALQVEADVDEDPRLTQRVRVSQKREGLHQSVEDDSWEAILGDFQVSDRFEFDYGLDLADRPVPETILSGTVLGVKGRILVLEHGQTAYAVDLRDLVGYDLETEGPAQLQSSLGAY